VFAKEEFKCPPTAAIGRSEFEQGGKRGAVVRGSPAELRGVYPLRLMGEFFVSFAKIISYNMSRDERRMEGMHRIMCGHSILSALSYYGWYSCHRQPHYLNRILSQTFNTAKAASCQTL